MSFLRKLFGGESADSKRTREDVVERIEREVAAEHEAGALSSAGAGHTAQADDRYELLAAHFEDDQYAEYEAHGARMKEALVLLHEGEIKRARALLEELVTQADAPRYLLLELGRARIADDAAEPGAQALQTFLSKLHAEEGGDARLTAHVELAAIAHAGGDVEGAIAHYEAALEAAPSDPRAYLAMAGFFRSQELWDEALEVLEAGMSVIQESGRWRFWQEQGLAHAGAGRDKQARALLTRTLDYLLAHRERDLPPEAAVTLAKLHEAAGEPARALALLVLLIDGSDEANKLAYRMEAARLMIALGDKREAAAMLQSAHELAPSDELRAAITDKLAQLQG